jgi:hypothetical protein
MTDEPTFLPAWWTKQQARLARETAQRVRRWFGPCRGADELDEFAQELDPDGEPLPDLAPIKWPTEGTITLRIVKEDR